MPVEMSWSVKELRHSLGDSQQDFAVRLHISIRSIANYEKERIPPADVLIAMARLADQSGERDLAFIFLRGVFEDLRIEPEEFFNFVNKIAGNGPPKEKLPDARI